LDKPKEEMKEERDLPGKESKPMHPMELLEPD
jgi:hypothetical protein